MKTYLPQDNKLKTLLKWMLGLSLLVHLSFFVGLPKSEPPLLDLDQETEIEVDLGSIGEDKLDNIAAIKDKKVAEEATVPDNMLPQIAKNIQIKVEKAEEEQPTEPEKKPDEIKEEPIEKVIEKKKEEEKKEEKEAVPPPVKKEDTNLIDEAELQKRLALEKLKELAPKGKELRVQNADGNLVDIKDENGEVQNKNSGESISPRVARACNSMVRKLMQNHYSLPPNYYIEKPNIQVQVDTQINVKGDVVSTNIAKSSGDKAFDEIVKSAIVKASPFPEVCYPYAGSNMKLIFSPQSL